MRFLTLSTRISSADDRSKFTTFRNFQNSNFRCHIWKIVKIQLFVAIFEKMHCILSAHTPSIGSEDFQTALDFETIWSNFSFYTKTWSPPHHGKCSICFHTHTHTLNIYMAITYRSLTKMQIIADVANSKCHQQLDEILFYFLPTLHRGTQQSCFQENCVMLYARETWCNHVPTAYACYKRATNLHVSDRVFS